MEHQPLAQMEHQPLAQMEQILPQLMALVILPPLLMTVALLPRTVLERLLELQLQEMVLI